MRKFLFEILSLLPICAFADGNSNYSPLSLTGYNADLILTTGEDFWAPLDKQGWCFFSEEKGLRGGLPERIRGLFSDVPYVFGDFKSNCAFILSDTKNPSNVVYGRKQTITLATPTKAKTLWLLATAADGKAKVNVTVNYQDGTKDSSVGIEVNDWKSDQNTNTAFWQLGRINGSGEKENSYNYALYEKAVPVASPSKEIASISVEMTDTDKEVAIFAVTASSKDAPSALKDKKMFFLSNSHLDTQWNWTVKTTISEYIKNTLTNNFDRFRDSESPNFNFNFEGAIHYMWAKEYYPTEFARLKEYIKQGRWNIAGGSIDANDVNIGSAESQMRNFLYGQDFYLNEFGQRGGRDIMLPDCFGFPWSLPTIAAHCGMKYFHTNKLSWNSAYAYKNLPRYARWIGTDGSELLAVLKTNPYDDHEKFRKDMSSDSEMTNEINSNNTTYGIPAALKYVGPRGDRGGGLDKETAVWLSKSVDSDGPQSVAINSSTEMLDQIFHMGYDKLPTINHGLPMRAHGVGAYTSRTMLKFWMRKGELLGGAAEGASVAANWLKTLPYQQSTLKDAWIRLLWHQFHDDIPGTSINDAYRYSVNDQLLNQLDFSRTLNNAVGAVASNMNTNWCNNIPVVVYNPISQNRTDIVEATITMPAGTEYIDVKNPNGQSVASQVLERNGNDFRFLFLATVPSMGYATYNVSPSTSAYNSNSGLSVSQNSMENGRYRIQINQNGDVSSIIDKKQGNKEMLSAPIRLAMLFDESLTWPSWEIHGDQLQKAPREYVDKEGLNVEVVENGPLRASLKVARTKNGSEFYQYINMYSAGSADRIDFVNEVNWQCKERMLKAVFPLTASNAEATYDLSIGADINKNSTNYSTDTNNTTSICEFLGHRWADVTNSDNSFGVSILNDCKYGWDKQKNNEIRLTLIHTPKVNNSYTYQGEQDLGLNKFTYSFFAHSGKWNADTQWEADKLNQPMYAYQTTKHTGNLGTDFCFVKVNNNNVAVKALKKAERSEKTIVRFYELTNNEQSVEAEFPANIVSAEEVNGVEELVGPATFSGKTLKFNIGRFHPKTFALTFAEPSNPATIVDTPTSTSVDLDYNIDVISPNSSRADAEISKAYPAELVDDNIVADGIVFKIGSKAARAKNAVKCMGQTVSLPAVSNGKKLYLLAASLNTDGSEATFDVDGKATSLRIEFNGGMAGVWSNTTDVQKHYRNENTAFTATHNHDVKGNKDAVYDYLYMYKYVIPVSANAQSLTLPDDDDILIFAISMSDNTNDDTKAISNTVNVLNHTDTEDPFQNVYHEDPALKPSAFNASGYTNSSEMPEMAADGDESTKWCDNSSSVKWLEYKFDKQVTVSGWRVMNAGSEGDQHISSEYKLQRFVNNGWVDADIVLDNTANTTDKVLERPFVTTAVRLRVVTPGHNNKKDAARIYEFKVFGHEATSDDMKLSQIISRRPEYGYGKAVARVVASSGRTKASEDPYFILDSDRTTKWCYNGSASLPYVDVKLADVYTLDRFDIYDSKTMEDYANSDSYSISVSMDGKTFNEVASKSGVASENVHTCKLSKPIEARYVRLQIAKGGGSAVRVYGFDIWGTFKEKAADEVGKPVSLDKTIIGAFNIKNFNESPLNIIDGKYDNIEHTWNFDNKDNDGKINWVVVDLESQYNINKFVIRDANTSGVNNFTGYRIYVSNQAPTETEMSRFKSFAGGSKWTRAVPLTKDNNATKTFTLDTPTKAQYVKLEIPAANVKDSAMVREFEIYGELVPTGISNVGSSDDINVYPNVVDRGMDLHVTAPLNSQYVLSNVGGCVVAQGFFGNETTIATNEMAPGIYLIRVKAGNQILNKKIIIR